MAGGAELVVAAGSFGGVDAGGAGDAGAAGGLAGAADGAGAVAALGALAGVCASAPEARRGNPTSAPANQTRSVMRQDPTQKRRASCESRTDSLFAY